MSKILKDTTLLRNVKINGYVRTTPWIGRSTLQSKPAVDRKSSDLVPVLKVTSELDFEDQIHYN